MIYKNFSFKDENGASFREFEDYHMHAHTYAKYSKSAALLTLRPTRGTDSDGLAKSECPSITNTTASNHPLFHNYGFQALVSFSIASRKTTRSHFSIHGCLLFLIPLRSSSPPCPLSTFYLALGQLRFAAAAAQLPYAFYICFDSLLPQLTRTCKFIDDFPTTFILPTPSRSLPQLSAFGHSPLFVSGEPDKALVA